MANAKPPVRSVCLLCRSHRGLTIVRPARHADAGRDQQMAARSAVRSWTTLPGGRQRPVGRDGLQRSNAREVTSRHSHPSDAASIGLTIGACQGEDQGGDCGLPPWPPPFATLDASLGVDAAALLLLVSTPESGTVDRYHATLAAGGN